METRKAEQSTLKLGKPIKEIVKYSLIVGGIILLGSAFALAGAYYTQRDETGLTEHQKQQLLELKTEQAKIEIDNVDLELKIKQNVQDLLEIETMKAEVKTTNR